MRSVQYGGVCKTEECGKCGEWKTRNVDIDNRPDEKNCPRYQQLI